MKKVRTLLILFGTISIIAQKKNVFQDYKLLANETTKVVSVKPGEPIDTAYLRTLFVPDARFTIVGEENGKKAHETMDLNEFIKSLTDEYYLKGYQETPQGMVTEEFNGIAHVLHSFYGEDSDGVTGWGVGSFQLIYSGDRWWISNMIWTMSPKGKAGIPNKLIKN